MVETPDTIWRDYETVGAPASGAHKPIKSEIRALHNDTLARVTQNESDISDNAADIATNAADITSLEASRTSYESAWSDYTPTLTPGSGTLTTASASGRYKQIGKIVFVNIRVGLSNIGTAATSLSASLPVTSVNSSQKQMLNGTEFALNGKGINGRIDEASSVAVLNYADGATSILQNGSNFQLSGVYEAA